MTDPPNGRPALDALLPEVEATPLEFFDRWEQQQWSITDIDLTSDRSGWQGLRPFTQRELRGAMEGFLVGESAVTETLAPLVHAAPTPEEQMFLATQLADEARHTLFFVRYLACMDRTAPVLPFGPPASESLADVLDGALREATSEVRRAPEERDAWYRSIVIYHLLVEGVLAVSGMRSILGALRGLPELPALAQAVTNVARDESRHIGFGVSALRTGVAEGYGPSVVEALCAFTPAAVRALVGPERRYPGLVSEDVQRTLGMELLRLWDLAEGALLGRSERIGIDARATDEVRGVWAGARDGALEEYRELHGMEHPVRRIAPRPGETLRRTA